MGHLESLSGQTIGTMASRHKPVLHRLQDEPTAWMRYRLNGPYPSVVHLRYVGPYRLHCIWYCLERIHTATSLGGIGGTLTEYSICLFYPLSECKPLADTWCPIAQAEEVAYHQSYLEY